MTKDEVKDIAHRLIERSRDSEGKTPLKADDPNYLLMQGCWTINWLLNQIDIIERDRNEWHTRIKTLLDLLPSLEVRSSL